MKSAIIIPARSGSTRLPNKPLRLISGKSLISRVWDIASQVKNVDDVYIATDDHDIKNHAETFQANVLMSDSSCKSGTDRISQVIENYSLDHEIIINLQGDAPLTPPAMLEDLITSMQNSDEKIITPMIKLTGDKLNNFIKSKSLGSRTGTTVVFDKNQYAMYFSKSIIPSYSDSKNIRELYRHIGVYAYRKNTILEFNRMPEGDLEKIEKLEQLRALENNIKIKMLEIKIDREMWSVDSIEDISIVESILSNEK